jgi:hypothetical protein
MPVLAAAALSLTGCGREKPSPVDATKVLEKSHENSNPAVKQAIQAANESLRAGRYQEALRTLAPIASHTDMTAAQKDAYSAALKQISDGFAANPSLDSKEMYELRRQMFQAVYRAGAAR